MSRIRGTLPTSARSARMWRRTRWMAVIVGCLLLTAACGEDSDPAPSGSDPETPSAAEPTRTEEPATTDGTTATTAAAGTTIVVGDSEFGEMLYDDTGQAIYLFDVETSAEPECYDECAEAWPPVFTDGEPVAGNGAPALLGTTERADGRLQVTYNDHPLYSYAHEGKNEVLCHDVFLNGGNWYLVQATGDAAPPG
jgi:predicted lipoprotein with Yx(FWY)xxD motif